MSAQRPSGIQPTIPQQHVDIRTRERRTSVAIAKASRMFGRNLQTSDRLESIVAQALAMKAAAKADDAQDAAEDELEEPTPTQG